MDIIELLIKLKDTQNDTLYSPIRMSSGCVHSKDIEIRNTGKCCCSCK